MRADSNEYRAAKDAYFARLLRRCEAAPPKDVSGPAEGGLSRVPGAGKGLNRGSLNAILHPQLELFNVIPVTLPASNVTNLTKKQTYCG